MSPRRPGPPANGSTSTPGNRTPTELPDSQLIFLAERLSTAIAKQPELADLRTVLLGIGGTELVAPPGDVDPDVPILLAEGRIMGGLTTLVEMRASDCHTNVARLWLQRYHYMVGVCSGYALSDDGLWRQHSWGLMRDGILETTVLRQVYFGISYCPEMSDRLAATILA